LQSLDLNRANLVHGHVEGDRDGIALISGDVRVVPGIRLRILFGATRWHDDSVSELPSAEGPREEKLTVRSVSESTQQLELKLSNLGNGEMPGEVRREAFRALRGDGVASGEVTGEDTGEATVTLMLSRGESVYSRSLACSSNHKTMGLRPTRILFALKDAVFEAITLPIEGREVGARREIETARP
jgi:hypothetical protein